MNNKESDPVCSVKLETGEGLPAHSKPAQAAQAPVAENSSLSLNTTGPLCCPSCCGAQTVIRGPTVGAHLLVACGQLTNQLVLAHFPLLLQAFKILHPRSLEDQD